MKCNYCNREIGKTVSSYTFKCIELHNNCFDKLLMDLNKQKELEAKVRNITIVMNRNKKEFDKAVKDYERGL